MLPLLLVIVGGLAGAAPARAEVHLTLTDLNEDARVVDPQFKWDPIPRAVRYEVEVNPSIDWAIGSRVCCDDKAIGTSLSPVKLLPNNTYYWRVRAFFAGGDAGAWHVWCGEAVPECPADTAPKGFDKTFDAVTPTVPNLRVRDSAGDHLPPAGGPWGLPTTGEPVLAWDPVPGASSYELRLGPYEPLGGFCNWTAPLPLGATFTTAATAWTPLGTNSTGSPVGNAHPGVTVGGALQDGTTYCVRVRARSDRDAKGGEIVSDWTQIGGLGHAAFTYEATSLPPCHATSMPAEAYHDEPSSTEATPRTPLFTWDRVDGACGYYVVVAKDPEFTKVLDVAFTTDPAYAPRAGSNPATYPDETTSYYWAVMPSSAGNGNGVSTQPQEDHPQLFNKRSVAPTPLAPTAGVTGEPSFRWSAAEGARSYRIQVDDDPNFGTPITDVVTDSTAYTSVNKYPAGKDLYWRVRANDETGIGLAWAPTLTFTALPPETFVDTGPDLQGSTASFTFSSDLPDATFKCRLDGPGTKVGSTVACYPPMTYPSLADGDYTFTVTAADLAGNADPTPAKRAFTVDTAAPDTTLSSAPNGTIAVGTATMRFAATQAGSHFECKLDGPDGDAGTWTACVSPVDYDGLADGGYSFAVRAIDGAGNIDPTPATAQFGVDTVAPDTDISAGPDPTQPSPPSVGFRFAGSEAGASFECRLDGPGRNDDWSWCESPTNYAGLNAGKHRFLVRAIDAAGNVDASPADWTFTVRAAAPASPPTGQQGAQGPSAPASSSTPPASEPPASTSHQLGAFTFAAPRRAVRVRRGAARLRFACGDADGCAGRTFVLRGPRFTLRITVPAGGPGSRSVTVRMSPAARRGLRRVGRRGVKVTVRATGAGPASRFRLIRVG